MKTCVGAGSWGTKKMCFCSALGFLLGFMLVCWDLGFTRWDSLYLKNIRKCCLCKVSLFSPWFHEPWLLGIQPVFWRKTLAPGGEVHHTGMETGARNFAFFHVKWLRPAMKSTSCVRRVRLGSFWFVLCVLK